MPEIGCLWTYVGCTLEYVGHTLEYLWSALECVWVTLDDLGVPYKQQVQPLTHHRNNKACIGAVIFRQ